MLPQYRSFLLLGYPLSKPLYGRYIINTCFYLFPTKKIGRFSTVFACPYFTVTARGCQSLVPCFSLISWSCTRILFFLSTTALGCAFNVLLHACTVAPNAVTAFIIRCHRSHVNPFTRPKKRFLRLNILSFLSYSHTFLHKSVYYAY